MAIALALLLTGCGTSQAGTVGTATTADSATTSISSVPTPTPSPVAGAISSDAAVEASASATTLRVGERVTISVEAHEIFTPNFYLIVEEGGAIVINAAVYPENPNYLGADRSEIVELVSAGLGDEGVVVVLEARQPGTAVVRFSVSGEVQTGEGAWVWSEAGSDSIELTIAP